MLDVTGAGINCKPQERGRRQFCHPMECRCLERLEEVTGNLQQEDRHIQLPQGDLAWREPVDHRETLSSLPLPSIGTSYSRDPAKKMDFSSLHFLD